MALDHSDVRHVSLWTLEGGQTLELAPFGPHPLKNEGTQEGANAVSFFVMR